MRRWWRRRSLRARLTLVASAATALGLLAGAGALGVTFARSRIGELDRAVRQRADVVRQLAVTDRLPQVLPSNPGAGELVEVVDERNQVLAASVSASRTLGLLDADQLGSWPRGRPRSNYDDRLTAEPLRILLVDGRLSGPLAGRPAGSRVTVIVAVPLGGVLETLGALRRTVLIVLPLLIGAVGAGSWLLAGSALRPVGGLRRGAERIRDVGGGGVLPVPAGGDEVTRLAITLNTMLDRLASAGARQRGFLADAAHELRSPLTALRTTLEVTAAHPRNAGEDAIAADLLPDVLRLARLVDDLLTLARLDEDVVPSRRAAVDLAAVAADLAADPAADLVTGSDHGNAGATGRPAVTVAGTGTAWADPDAVRRILQNLLDNARRHAVCRVHLEVAPGSVTVADDGAGVPAAQRERVFDRFTRLDDARTRDAGGSGLGLAIARELARANGGDLTVESASLGGAAFRLTLP